ncbi:MAG: Stk1 family PASTA domain-containing Ser/Thr kinase [Lactobacillaceae bacterium]|jgi:serine/threonine-protein kinase|nr:Stk1 family PASTA domain-containing Ser/Thr kinase [Lactobacillaceae bacterium]
MNPGTVFANRYLIKRPLGEGGMANVYLAEDLSTNQQVAIKTLRLDLQENPDFVRRFQREAQSASRLIHPNIVQVYDSGNYEGTQYLVMEYVEGIDLKTYIKKFFPIPYAQVVNIMEQILSAVSMAHNHGIVHRDLKPQNILIDSQGMVKITDFGIAVARSEFGMTQTNTVLGTIHYLSPEQVRGGTTSNKSDIYSLGIILYEMLAGRVPYEGENAVQIAMKHSNDEIPPLRNIDPNVPQPLENVIIRATAKNPDNRYLTAEDMANDLRTVLSPERAAETRLKFLNNDMEVTKAIPVSELRQSMRTGLAEEAPQEISNKSKTVSGNRNNQRRKRGSKMSKRNKIIAIVVGGLLLLGIAAIAANMFGPKYITLDNYTNKSQASVQKVLVQNGLKVGTVSKTTSKTIKKGYVISTDPKAGKRLKKGATVNLVVSNGNKKVAFGNYIGGVYTQVKRVLENQGYTVKKTEEYSDSVPEGSIISQSIDETKKVDPKKTTVEFVVSKGTEVKKVAFGNYEGMVYSEVRQALEGQGYTVLSSKDYSDTVAEGSIISQSITEGTEVDPKSTTVTFVVSQGAEPQSSSSSSSSSSSTPTPTPAAKTITVPNFPGVELYQTWGDQNGVTIVTNPTNAQGDWNVTGVDKTTVEVGGTVTVTAASPH